jgi:hypothetical protein
MATDHPIVVIFRCHLVTFGCHLISDMYSTIYDNMFSMYMYMYIYMYMYMYMYMYIKINRLANY